MVFSVAARLCRSSAEDQRRINKVVGHWRGTLKLQDWTLQDWTMTDDIAGVDIAGLDIDGRLRRGGHCRTGH